VTEKIVITGMGTVNPIGLSVKETWENTIQGKSGLGRITLFDASEFPVQYACEVKGFNPENYMPAKNARRRDRFQQFSTVAANEAIMQAGLDGEQLNLSRIGVIISSAIGGLNSLYDAFETIRTRGPRSASPFSVPMIMSDGGAGLVAIDHGFQGPCFSIASACASGADALGVAWMMLRSGIVDAVVAGASDALITSFGLASFERMGVLSHRGDNYSNTPQPFDLDRDGLVMGEGAAVIILETESYARQRGTQILAELAGYGSTEDAYHITAPTEYGQIAARAMDLALNSAKINKSDVGYINAHGTATKLNDLAETYAIKKTFGDLAYNVPISSTKSMTGHMIGATGALEVIFCVLAIREGILPPTINLHTPDPQCDLDYVPNQARERRVQIVMSNSFGFAGHNAALLIREY